MKPYLGTAASLALWMTWYNEDLFNQAGVRSPTASAPGGLGIT